ncbi:MarC family protein [Deefgea piscis]|uniref:UPF0056 membrane protein n=2 Tax=Deefgea TaxID=400947 RepID=A0A6M8SPT9_9NEIS|nr:MarC family protein [Deefgea piscis]QKJ66178.1 MarC family protein [Deefgea piscis]
MLPYLSSFFGSLLLVFAALMPILNPPGHAPIFLVLTEGYTKDERIILAKRVGVYSFILLVFSMFIGIYVLEFFGVSLPIVRVGGGLLVATAGWQLMSADTHAPNAVSTLDGNRPSSEELRQRAFFPLTFPITVGPGSITVAITLGASFKSSGIETFTMPIASVIAVAITSYSVYWCYRYADKLLKWVGATGSVIFLRLSAFILFCLGIQIFWTGATDLMGAFVQLHWPR